MSDNMTDSNSKAYHVLARKYRPTDLDSLIGQDALVKTLRNAITHGRLAHAFILTGVRGIGKTSTARILARGLNCVGEAGDSNPTLTPCGVCQHCRDIADGRHIDVLEMDAASNTGVDDVREIIDAAAYKPVSARFKIYIIDEVHMLSRSAFNALLKTLEEPPEKVKFIFATTEIRKVPVTILSRCQRFDLRRVPTAILSKHLASIAEKEAISIDQDALMQISHAATGSVRDGLSLLDQAAAMGADQISSSAVTAMLGGADMLQIAHILSACLDGEIAVALDIFAQADAGGADAEHIIADILELIHQASLLATGADIDDFSDELLSQLRTLSAHGIARLGRAWQLVLAGHRDLRSAPNPESASQMILIRLAYMAPMPTPAEIIKSLPKSSPQTPATSPTPAATQPPPTSSIPLAAQAQQDASVIPDTPLTPELISLRQIASMLDDHGHHILAAKLRTHIRIVAIKDNRLDIQIDGDDRHKLGPELAKILSQMTGSSWLVHISETGGGTTIAEQDEAAQKEKINDFAKRPDIAHILNQFEGAEITDMRENERP